jgi:TonB family protein
MRVDRCKVKLRSRPFWLAVLCLMVLSLVGLNVSAQESRKLIVQEAPAYPAVAKAIHLTGTVKIQVVISKDGNIRETKVLGGHPLLVDASLDAIKKWKYAPAQSESTTTLEFNFHP